ncbi:thiolase domain-containing protein [Amycolatopsis acidiphila]|uniref:Lipid-transfer protein n=1 Tax=Amycolatopsis acidiphila TaxID=715473 RepID=A0A558AF09_9PSEU|nr:thiolase domain-containing protein [Amycolatopsis acidiphila]TVT22845.1 lipid-transfer protein [Amycolatopsis acidiphila]UIJ58143.1 thiolase domain-containing protein [Amycolatopsis acidiphila]GHG69820.1 lipid-transfer protein [Amycolatopsis acidiphila]
MSDVAVVGFAQAPNVRRTPGTTNGVEMLVPIFAEVFRQTGLSKQDIGFWCSGSSDYLAGRAFSFISAVDAIGAFPPIHESHVEMDAAWALYEAWLKIRMGEVDTALVYGFGKSSAGQLRRVLALQLDPYAVAPLWPDSISIAALQARLGLDAGLWSEKDLAEVAARYRDVDVSSLLDEPYLADPLRPHDVAPITDGAAVIILASAARAKEFAERPALITGIEHRVDTPVLGARDLTRAPSAEAAARAAGASGVEVAELHAPFTHQELILRASLGLDEQVRVNPSGGALTGNPMFAAGLARIGEAAKEIFTGRANRVLAHATSGPALQQNLVAVMEGLD